MTDSIFVYGTLMDDLLKEVFPVHVSYIRMVRRGKINARLFDLGEYPGARRTTIRSKSVSGKIFEIDAEHLKSLLTTLDQYEGFDPKMRRQSLYVREMAVVNTENGQPCEAWIYWYNRPVMGYTEIEGGDYYKYLEVKKPAQNAPE